MNTSKILNTIDTINKILENNHKTMNAINQELKTIAEDLTPTQEATQELYLTKQLGLKASAELLIDYWETVNFFRAKGEEHMSRAKARGQAAIITMKKDLQEYLMIGVNSDHEYRDMMLDKIQAFKNMVNTPNYYHICYGVEACTPFDKIPYNYHSVGHTVYITVPREVLEPLRVDIYFYSLEDVYKYIRKGTDKHHIEMHKTLDLVDSNDIKHLNEFGQLILEERANQKEHNYDYK
jgi:hypothetical protein